MKQLIFIILDQRNLDSKKYNMEVLYQAGINNVYRHIEFYHDKQYTCQSVIKELFERGVIEKIEKS